MFLVMNHHLNAQSKIFRALLPLFLVPCSLFSILMDKIIYRKWQILNWVLILKLLFFEYRTRINDLRFAKYSSKIDICTIFRLPSSHFYHSQPNNKQPPTNFHQPPTNNKQPPHTFTHKSKPTLSNESCSFHILRNLSYHIINQIIFKTLPQ